MAVTAVLDHLPLPMVVVTVRAAVIVTVRAVIVIVGLNHLPLPMVPFNVHSLPANLQLLHPDHYPLQ